MRAITPCLWFDNQAEEAAKFYTSIFKNSKIGRVSRYGKEGFEVHGRKEGTVMAVEFELNGQPFSALNGGPLFKFNEAMSLGIYCKTQEELDYYWERLSDGGPGQCGWLKDKFGVSWQVVPEILADYMTDPDKQKSGRVMAALLKMNKLDLAALKRAYEGNR